MGVVRAKRSVAAAWVWVDERTAASASSSSLRASSTSLREAMPFSSRIESRSKLRLALSSRAWAEEASPDRVARSERSGGASKRTTTAPWRTASPVAYRISVTRDFSGAVTVQSAPGAGSMVPVTRT